LKTSHSWRLQESKTLSAIHAQSLWNPLRTPDRVLLDKAQMEWPDQLAQQSAFIVC
jgi:hypothetical protein